MGATLEVCPARASVWGSPRPTSFFASRVEVSPRGESLCRRNSGAAFFFSMCAELLRVNPAQCAHGSPVVVFPRVEEAVEVRVQLLDAGFSRCIQAYDCGDNVGQLQAYVICLGDGKERDFKK